jgi:hypothetical protein
VRTYTAQGRLIQLQFPKDSYGTPPSDKNLKLEVDVNNFGNDFIRLLNKI